MSGTDAIITNISFFHKGGSQSLVNALPKDQMFQMQRAKMDDLK